MRSKDRHTFFFEWSLNYTTEIQTYVEPSIYC
jgi:hypothetical protein